MPIHIDSRTDFAALKRLSDLERMLDSALEQKSVAELEATRCRRALFGASFIAGVMFVLAVTGWAKWWLK